jgi:phenol hydroxylase P5 protein
MSYEVTIEPLGETIEVEEDQTILDAALRAGIWLPHACCHGLCATCKVDVVDGEVEQGDASPFALMDFERDEGKCLACCATPTSDLVIEADIEEDADAEVHPVEDYAGVVVAIEALTPTAKSVIVELDRELKFQAGQYVNLHLPEIGQTRAFSLANSPSEKRRVELQIRHIPGGEATSFVHQQLKVGDKVDITGPYGRFFVRRSADADALFLACGTGISSPKSMILDLLEQGDDRNIKLFHGARNQTELYDRDLFEQLAADFKNFRYTPVLSQPNGDQTWEGAVGYVQDVAQSHLENDFRGHQAYLCGSPNMIDSAITVLMQGRLFERDIYFEKFISAADAAQQSQRSPLFKSI